MNKRIRKKKAKQQLIRAISGLVEAAEEMQREQERRTRQAGISYIKYGNCILLDDGDTCVCPQLISYSLLCKWFRIAVLPLDKLLYAELYQTEDRKKCTVCGAFFASTSNSVKYCPDCRKRITRRQAAERMRKRRALVTR